MLSKIKLSLAILGVTGVVSSGYFANKIIATPNNINLATTSETANTSASIESSSPTISEEYYGNAGALKDTELTLQDMLTYALQDEYTARAEYDLIISKLKATTPFTNIIKAEGNHISSLLTLFKAYNYAVPVNDAASRVTLPSSLTESYKTGIEAEKNNIAMYEKFLKEDLPADIKNVFLSLKAASQSHLKAFENAGSNTYSGLHDENSSNASVNRGRGQGAGTGTGLGNGGQGKRFNAS